jgi:hypothetical protein
MQLNHATQQGKPSFTMKRGGRATMITGDTEQGMKYGMDSFLQKKKERGHGELDVICHCGLMRSDDEKTQGVRWEIECTNSVR